MPDVKIKKDGQEYDIGVIPQSMYDDVEDLKDKMSDITIQFVYFSLWNVKTSATLELSVPALVGKTIVFVANSPMYFNMSVLNCKSEYSSTENKIIITKPNASFGGDGAEFKVLVGYLKI